MGGNNTPPAYYPSHKFPTYYQYNSLNQVTYQWSPDAGGTRLIYDEMRRLVRSHNANQLKKKFSYTLYDYLNRVSEVGEVSYAVDLDTTITATTYSAHRTLVNGGVRSQITRTFYDKTLNNAGGTGPIGGYFGAAGQENLRGRISTVMYSPANGTLLNGLPLYESASHYSYDIQGNVKILIQDHNTFGQKRVDYEYELISGNVKKVWYQKYRWDQFIHYYFYDLDNRLTSVETSIFPTAVNGSNSGIRHKESAYFYYRYGPVQRMELGALQVQGLDYAYTIHGWLKGVNAGTLKHPTFDIGKDGKPGATNAPVARDAFGFVLGYYSNSGTGQKDYHSIGNSTQAPVFDPMGYTVLGDTSLYNGNIPQMITTTREPASISFRSQRMNYKYDQLQRLKKQTAWEWNGSSFGLSPYTGYGMNITYDYAGNIKTLKRDGYDASNLSMDDLTYVYATNTKPNRLLQITDAAGATSNYTDDIEPQGLNNYAYDNIGNMINDASEGGKTVTWNVYNKITAVSMSGGTKTLAFGYDATGNRVRKESTVSGTNTKQWYVRDAQGNILSVYKQVGAGTMKQEAVYLYGSARLGEYALTRDSAVTWNKHYYRIKGNRHYELTNHLGNILAVVTDRKMAQDTTADATYNAQYFLPDIYSVQNYYAFGQDMPKWSTNALNDPKRYRFGFNGKEDDDEWTKQDYGFRIYDARIARFLSVDPMAMGYPWNSTYSFGENDVIRSIDLDGLEKAIVINRYNSGNISRTVISTLSSQNTPINIGATGNGISGLTINDILEINIGQLPVIAPGSSSTIQPFVVKQQYNPNELSIINSGVDNSRALTGRASQRETDHLDDVGNFSFPGSYPPNGQIYTSNASIGTWTQVPIFENRTVSSPETISSPFPGKTIGGIPFGINPLSGEISPPPIDKSGYNQVKALFELASKNNIKNLNVSISMTLGSNIDAAELQDKIANNLKGAFNYSGKVNVNISRVGSNEGNVTISSPGGTIKKEVTTTKQVQVQVGTQDVLNPN